MVAQIIPFNGDGSFENHWNFAMVAKRGPKSPNSFDSVLSFQKEVVKATDTFIVSSFNRRG